MIVPERAHNHTKTELCPKCCQKCSIKFNLIISNVCCQIVLVPNCPVTNCPGTKLSGCQIVHFYYLGAKLSAFIMLVPNCPLYYLGAKLSGAKLSGAKLSYNRCLDCRNILNAWTVGEFFFWG